MRHMLILFLEKKGLNVSHNVELSFKFDVGLIASQLIDIVKSLSLHSHAIFSVLKLDFNHYTVQYMFTA